MSKSGKMIVSVLAAILLIIGSYCLLRFGFDIDILDRSGWHSDENGVCYLNYFGQPQLQWQNISGKTYYFDPKTGTMVIGWLELDGDRYYFAQDGVLTYGLQTIEDRLYYLGDDGKMATGWQELDGQRYFFAQDGTAVTGWQELEGNRHYFAQDGEMSVGWTEIAGERYCFTQAGQPMTGWVQIDGTRYLFAEEGTLVTGWHTDDTGTYFLEEDGKVHTGWLDSAGERYYLDQNGMMQTGWLEIGDDRYYLKSDGAMAVGMVFVDSEPTFFTSQGKHFLFINSDYGMPEDYVADLVYMGSYQLDRQCAKALEQMLERCREEGYWWSINDAYRSKQSQQGIWNSRIQRYMNQGYSYQAAIAQVGASVAVPGHSEHETGLAVDIGGTSATYRWLAENCWDYGFILRYPENCTAHTGIVYEPWHFRYVGTELSLEMETLGICLEEYMEILNLQKKSQS